MLLTHIRKNEFVEIVDVSGEVHVVERLFELGIQRGAHIRSLGRAPLWGPFIYQIGNTVVAMRKREAECVQIQRKV